MLKSRLKSLLPSLLIAMTATMLAPCTAQAQDVTVTKYEITYETITGGTVVADVTEAAAGETVTLTVTPDDGSTLSALTVITMVEGTIDDPGEVWAPRRSPGVYDDFHYPLGWFKKETLTLTEVDDTHYTFVMPTLYEDYDEYMVRVGATFEGPEPIKYAVTVTQCDNGTTSVSPTEAAEGETVTITAMPASGYDVDVVYAYWFPNLGMFSMETELTTTSVDATHYTFVMPAGAATVRVTYKEGATKYPINIQSMTGGTVTSDLAEASIGQTVTLTVTPNENYELETLTVTAGYEVQGGGGNPRSPRKAGVWTSQGNINLTQVDATHYTFVLPEELPSTLTPNYTSNTEFRVNATFTAGEPTKYVVTVTQQTGGTTSTDVAEAAENETVTITAAPDSGYEVDAVSAYWLESMGFFNMQNDLTVTTVDATHFTFVMPAAAVTVKVTYKQAATKYPINIQSMTGGTVTSDLAEASIGQTVTLTVTPNEGYELNELSVIAGYEPVISDDDDDRAPRRAPAVSFISQGEMELTQVDATHYTFVLPENFPGAFTDNYVDNTEFRVYATFNEVGPAPVTLAEALVGEEGDVIISSDVKVVVANNAYAIVSDGLGNWLKVTGQIPQEGDVIANLSGEIGGLDLNPVMELESYVASEAIVDVTLAGVNLATVHREALTALKPNEVAKFVGYYNAESDELCAFSTGSGLHIAMTTDNMAGSIVAGKQQTITGVVSLKQAWDAPSGAPARVAIDDDQAFENIQIDAVAASVPTGLETVKMLNDKEIQGIYNVNGQQVRSPESGVYIIRYTDGTSAKVRF